MSSELANPPLRLLPGLWWISRVAIVLAAALLGWTVPLRATPVLPLGPLHELRAQERRVASVTYKLALANRTLCRDVVAPQLGFTLHGLDQYETADRGRMAATFGLGPHAGVMAVVPFSPADEAGLENNDQLVSVNGRTLSGGAVDPSRRPTRAIVEGTEKLLLEEMRTGEVTLRISGARGIRDIRFVPDLGCSSNVELAPGDDVNAWADGERVVISAGLVARCATDADLALVISHELAHNLLHHSDEPIATGDPQSMVMRLLGSDAAGMTAKEEDADRLAVRMASAAYDMTGAEAFMSRLLNDPGTGTFVAGTHPATQRRLELLKAEIAATRASSPQPSL